MEENAKLKRELADVKHRLRNLNEQYLEEVTFWRARALELKLQLALPSEAARTSGGGEGTNGHSKPPSAAEKRLELEARKASAEQRVKAQQELSAQLTEQSCQRALHFLTKEGGAADTFARSLDQLDVGTLRWAQHQIEMRWRDLARLSEPREPPARGPRQASDIRILAREVLQNRSTMAELLSCATGKTKEQVVEDTNRCYYMQPDEAVQYGLIDKVLTPEKLKAAGDKEVPSFVSAMAS
ncbi:unnamed protein product [Effrenium voratum]|nr:unnamed protein product [Effrenium voratum]